MEARRDIDKTNNIILRLFAVVFHSPLTNPFKSILLFAFIFALTVLWVK
ncbi:hypothetical protein ACAN107058_21650 [Paracidovorax anthurii]|uniref:Uncharacterized protein n=1 Tax=Paracidovorax anthurii TaxID=78229 RepID=A0A328YCA1_9BURK|nr:hypothetical protein AX018_11201 [Paracidovorax anthurii]